MFKRAKMNKNRRTNRKAMYLVLAFACVSLLSMTLVYAALSTTLKITGTAKFKDASFGLTLEEIPATSFWEYDDGMLDGNVVTYGTAKLLKKPTIVGTSINDYRISLTKPDDGIYLYYKLTNIGNIPVELGEPTWMEPTFTSSNNSLEDVQLMQDYFDYDYYFFRVTEDDGFWHNYDDFYTNDVLCPGETVLLEIGSWYDWDATAVPSSNITISNLGAQFNFVATDYSVCNDSTTNDQ